MPKDFKYDVVLLIESVRDRPCLWDKSLENYKDRVERRTAWEEIFSILDESYEEMSPEMKRITGELILNKWTNIRDTFVKTLKTRMGKPKKKYLLYEHLKFLTKITPEEHYNLTNYDVEVPMLFKLEEEKIKPSYSRKRTKQVDENEMISPKKSPVFDATNELDFVGVDETNDPRVMNEDEAFFASLLPTVVKYNEDERLEFRMEVLAVMKNIKDKRVSFP
ncbi:PREDICTED: uncharacterized protein LOC106111310 [Papilio polytes]|uniref:uncharacterized protein LOC106111310 n=1 Tax=Papilio polytes TaxID=76194 RepID=UPI000676689C|nr:PREDICTED: uncharacterized protein LOC106111310 [Papilio polytes]